MHARSLSLDRVERLEGGGGEVDRCKRESLMRYLYVHSV